MTLDTSVNVNVNVEEKLLLYSILFAKKKTKYALLQVSKYLQLIYINPL